MFWVFIHYGLSLHTQRYDNIQHQEDYENVNEFVLRMQQKPGTDRVYDILFSHKEKLVDKSLISTDAIAAISSGIDLEKAPHFLGDLSIQFNQCISIQLKKGPEIVLVFQTSFDSNLFLQSAQAILDGSMFDPNLTPLPPSSRVLIDKCVAEKSESIGWGDRILFLVPYKLLIYSSEINKKTNKPAASFPRNVSIIALPHVVPCPQLKSLMQIISLKGAQVKCHGKEVHITVSLGTFGQTYASKFRFKSDALAVVRVATSHQASVVCMIHRLLLQRWASKLNQAGSVGTESAISGMAGSASQALRVGYNDELPVPGVIIKEDQVAVEGISKSGLKVFNVCLRVAQAGYASMLFKEELPSQVLIGGFIMQRAQKDEVSSTCAFVKNPRGEYGFCLRCDFTGFLNIVLLYAQFANVHTSLCRGPQSLALRGNANASSEL